MDCKTINEQIEKLRSNETHFLITMSVVIGKIYNESDKEFTPKLNWYTDTAKLILANDKTVSMDEKNEFLSIHKQIVKKFNDKGGKVKLESFMVM